MKFSRPQNLNTNATSSEALAKGGGIHEQNLRLSCKANRGLERVLEDYQGGNIIEVKAKKELANRSVAYCSQTRIDCLLEQLSLYRLKSLQQHSYIIEVIGML